LDFFFFELYILSLTIGTSPQRKKAMGSGNRKYSPVLLNEEKAPKDDFSVVTQVPFKGGASAGGGPVKGQQR
jgi:hypothetical protein